MYNMAEIIMIYTMGIKGSQADYIIDDIILKKSGGGQSSNYVGTEFFKDALEKNVIVQDTVDGYPTTNARGSDEQYILNDNYTFKLGKGIIALIGEEYKYFDNKFIVSLPQTKNGKPQLNKVVYKTLAKKDEGYEWFFKLYCNNISGNELILDIDEKEKKLTVDIRFSAVADFFSSRNYFQSTEIDDINFPHNRIVFGAPGTGKSYRLNIDKEIFGRRYERVTFHPNYSYSKFVGTYKPVPITDYDENGKEIKEITYKYVPGPFMRAFVESVNSNEPYLLLIEEINRANVTSVFGDVFQLLDRKDGVSEYPIETSEDIKDFLKEHIEIENFDYDRIEIPENMYIWATMNSADQGVFPMDTAFKRRWEFEYIGINDNDEKIKNIIVEVGEDRHPIKWNDLRTAINNKLSKENNINEDKLLGPYFLSKDILSTKIYEWDSKQDDVEDHPYEEDYEFGSELFYIEDNDRFLKAFKSKVIMYLFEDVEKQYGSRLFEGCSDSTKYSSICKEFDKKGEAIFGDDFINKYADKDE